MNHYILLYVYFCKAMSYKVCYTILTAELVYKAN